MRRIAAVLALSGTMLIVGAVGSYVTGRILFPEMGLRAPRFEIWLAIVAVGITVQLVLGLAKELLDEL